MSGPATAASASRISHPRKCASPFELVVCLRAAAVIESARKRTGPGGPPGLQNRSLPALRGGWVRLPGASASLRSTSAGFSPRSSYGWASQLMLALLLRFATARRASPRARRLSRRSDARTVVHPQRREGGPEAPFARARCRGAGNRGTARTLSRPAERPVSDAPRPWRRLRIAVSYLRTRPRFRVAAGRRVLSGRAGSEPPITAARRPTSGWAGFPRRRAAARARALARGRCLGLETGPERGRFLGGEGGEGGKGPPAGRDSES